MEPTATMSAAPVSTLERESLAERKRLLAAARRRATGFLVAATALFLGVTAAGAHGTSLGYVQAAAEAAMVGGIADWFAVTALFRRPLGLPIPHTALLVERKDQFAATLGQFVQENFLNAEVLAERIRSARLVPRLAAWLADAGNAARFAGHAADLVVTVAEALREEDVQRVLTAELTRAVDAVEVAPLAGRALRVIIAEGQHTELFEAAASAADRYLADHHEELRDRFEVEAPRWVPDAVYRRVFDRLYHRLRERLAAMVADPDDETRRQFEAWLAGLPARLETDPELRERGERLKRDVLGSAGLRDWSSALWQKAKETLRAQAADPDSELRRRLAEALAAAGRRLGSDQTLQDGLERMVESGARALADQFHDELAGLVTGTIERWDAAETSSQLELLFGRDLQFIRINGTVVGAAVGLALHAVVLALALSAPAAPGSGPGDLTDASQGAVRDHGAYGTPMEVNMASADMKLEAADPDIAARASLLHETAEHHGKFEAIAPPHDWWDWYAAYMTARETGSTPDQAAAAAGRYMAEVKHIVVAPA